MDLPLQLWLWKSCSASRQVTPGRAVLYGVVVWDFFNKYICLFLSALGLSYGMWDVSLWSAGSCGSVWASLWL